MEFVLLTVGRTGIDFVRKGLEEYCGRLRRYAPYSIRELPDARRSGKVSELEQKEAEGQNILSDISPSDYVILLDERGAEYTSREFAAVVQKRMAAGHKRVVFVVGGPYGFSRAVYDRADSKISLSRMTFNHEMARLFFTEQLYRALSILHGDPYHHD